MAWGNLAQPVGQIVQQVHKAGDVVRNDDHAGATTIGNN